MTQIPMIEFVGGLSTEGYLTKTQSFIGGLYGYKTCFSINFYC